MHLRQLGLCWLTALIALGCKPAQIGMMNDAGVAPDGAPACATGEGALGEACTCDEACGASAARCARDRILEPEGESYCTLDCASDPASCPLGYECTEGASSGGAPFCARCASETPGVVPVGEVCLCDADCEPGASGLASCVEGTCRVADCLVGDPSSCPEGFGCEAGPGFATFCAECVALGETPGAEGESCDCNADCGAGAPICLLGSLGDVAIDRCVRACVPDAGDCPTGTRCCGADRLLAPTCLADDVVTALGSMIQCAG